MATNFQKICEHVTVIYNAKKDAIVLIGEDDSVIALKPDLALKTAENIIDLYKVVKNDN